MPTSQSTLYDVTVLVSPALPTWPGDSPVVVAPDSRLADGDTYNLSHLSLSAHAGTHVDAPWHFVASGRRLDEIPLERWIGPCHVVDVRGATKHIEPADLESAHIPAATDRLLLHTTNSELWRTHPTEFIKEYVALSPASARWLVDHGMRLVGIDYASVDPFDDDLHQGHHLLLGNDVLIIENLDLGGIAPGMYELVCLPLKLQQIDGAPARVMLRDLP